MNLYSKQRDLFINSQYTNQTEWNLTFHYANELKKYLFWLDIDLDVIKTSNSRNRPDIIFHKRMTNHLNFLVVEMKRREGDDYKDFKKIRERWMGEPLLYPYGAYINIWDNEEWEAYLFVNRGDGVEQLNIDLENCNYIKVPKVNKKVEYNINKLLENKDFNATGRVYGNLLHEFIMNTFIADTYSDLRK
jgi:hypothetical protein